MLNKNTASVFLASLFLEHVRKMDKNKNGQIKANPSYKLSVIDDAYKVLGVLDYYDVKNKIINYDEEETNYYNLSKFLDIEPKLNRDSDELIILGQFYMHPRLQETRKPRRVLIDYETMEQVKQPHEEFFLEIIESFTLDDLMSYYYMKHLMDPAPGTAHKTQMSNLLNTYSLDNILYLIDASVISMYEEDIERYARTPAFLPNFIPEANELMNHRKNILIEGGLTKIVPRTIYERNNTPD